MKQNRTSKRMFNKPTRSKALKKPLILTGIGVTLFAALAATGAGVGIYLFFKDGSEIDKAQANQLQSQLNPSVEIGGVAFDTELSKASLQEQIKTLSEKPKSVIPGNTDSAKFTNFFVDQTTTLTKAITNSNEKLESLWDNFIQQHFTTGAGTVLSGPTEAGQTSLDKFNDLTTAPSPNSLGISSALNLGSSLSVGGAVAVGTDGAANNPTTTLYGDLNVKGTTTLDNIESTDFEAKGTLTVEGTITTNAVATPITIGATGAGNARGLTVTGNTKLEALEAKGILTIGGTVLTSNANISVTIGNGVGGPSSRNLFVTGDTTFGGPLTTVDASTPVTIGRTTGTGNTRGLTVTGATNLSTLETSGLATLNSLTVENAVSLGALTTSGNVTIGTAAANRTLSVTGATNLSTLETSGLATFNSLSVTETTTLNGNTTSNGNVTIGGAAAADRKNLTVNGITTTRTLTTQGITTLGGALTTVNATTPVTIGATGTGNTRGLTVTGATNLSTLETSGLATFNSLSVTETTTLNGNTTSNGNVTIGGAAAADRKNLTVNGITTTRTLTTQGITTLGGALTTVNATTPVTIGATGTGNTRGLTVTGATNLSTLETSGLATLNSLSVTETTTLNGNTTSNGNVTIGGAAAADRKNLTVNGITTTRTLTTQGITTLGGALTTVNATTPVTIGATGTANARNLLVNGTVSANSYNGMITTTNAVAAAGATPARNALVTLATTAATPAPVDLSVSGNLNVTGRVEDGNGELIKAKGSTTIVLQASEGQSIDTAIYKNQLRAEGYEVDDGRLLPGIQSGFVTIQTAFRRHSTNSATTPTATKGYQIKHPNLHTTSSNSLNAANTFMTTTPFLSRTTSGISALVNEFTVVELELVDPTAADATTKPATLKFLVNVDVFYLNLSGSLLLQLQKGEVTVVQSLNDSTLLAANIPTIAEVQALISATFTMPYAIIKV